MEEAKQLSLGEFIIRRLVDEGTIWPEQIEGIRNTLRSEIPSAFSGFVDALKAAEIDENPTIPSTAPEKWSAKNSPDTTPAHFIQRVYGAWLGKGLHTGHIRACDPTLGRAYDRWLEDPKAPGPDDFHLPTKTESLADQAPLSDDDRRHAQRLLGRERRAKSRSRVV